MVRLVAGRWIWLLLPLLLVGWDWPWKYQVKLSNILEKEKKYSTPATPPAATSTLQPRQGLQPPVINGQTVENTNQLRQVYQQGTTGQVSYGQTAPTTNPAPEVGWEPLRPQTRQPDVSLAPDFALKDVNGGIKTLSQYRGKIVIIDFWATWCGPCRRGIPELVKLQQHYGNAIQILGVTVDEDPDQEDLADFARRQGINYPVLLADDWVNYMYSGGKQAVSPLPSVFVVDCQGVARYKLEGLQQTSTFEQMIRQLAAEAHCQSANAAPPMQQPTRAWPR